MGKVLGFLSSRVIDVRWTTGRARYNVWVTGAGFILWVALAIFITWAV